jgi:hypothetical protein
MKRDLNATAVMQTMKDDFMVQTRGKGIENAKIKSKSTVAGVP